MSKTINNLVNHIEIVHGTSEKETIPKLGLRTIIQGDRIILVSPAGGSGTTSVRQSVSFLYTDVTSPSEASAEALRDVILAWIATGEAGEDLEGGAGFAYIGKPSGGDFVTTYISGTTINLGYRPAYLTGGTGAQTTPATWAAESDCDFRITADGIAYDVDATDFTGNTTMAAVAATIQAALRVVTSGLETVEWDTNHFVISSVLYGATSEISVLSTSSGGTGTDISGAGAAAWMDAETGRGTPTVVRGGYPPGITGFIDEDIEWVRQIATDGSVTATYERADVAMSITGHTLTVTGATFLSTDTFVVGTNVPRGSVDDIIRAGGGFYIGKPTNGDFVTAYTSAITITLSGLPTEIGNIEHEDIYIVRQFDAAGNVVKTFTKDDTLMSVAANVLTVTDGAFAATDTFVVYTNIPRVALVTDLSADIAPSYIGKNSGTNADFTVAYTAATQITLSAFTPDITQIYESDIEMIRHCNAAGVLIAEYTRANSTINDDGSSVITVTEAAFGATDLFVVFTNIPKPTGGGGGIPPDYKIGSYGGTVTYASNVTVTLAGSYPTINYDSQILYILCTDSTLNTAEIFRNGVNGVLIKHSAGTLTLVNAGTPFASTNVYEVGMSYVPISLDIGSDTTKTTEQAPDYGHYTDVETKTEADLGIDGVHDGGNGAADFTDTGETYTAQTVAEGHTIYNITDGSSALINSPDLLGAGGGAGDPSADDINHAALAGGGSNDWQNTETAGIPECKRFVFDMKSFNLESIDYLIAANDANNSCYMNVYITDDADADETDDTYWKDKSLEILGVAQVTADGIGDAAAAYVSDTCVVNLPTPVLKIMIKIVVEFKVASGQDNDFKIKIIKSS